MNWDDLPPFSFLRRKKDYLVVVNVSLQHNLTQFDCDVISRTNMLFVYINFSNLPTWQFSFKIQVYLLMQFMMSLVVELASWLTYSTLLSSRILLFPGFLVTFNSLHCIVIHWKLKAWRCSWRHFHNQRSWVWFERKRSKPYNELAWQLPATASTTPRRGIPISLPFPISQRVNLPACSPQWMYIAVNLYNFFKWLIFHFFIL